MTAEELLPLVDDEGRVLGSVARSVAHGDPSKLHPVVHCHVLGPHGRLLLQLRSATKDVQPGKWDTSVGGHVAFGESIERALARELDEELGLDARALAPRPLYRYVNRTAIETELVHSYLCESAGPFRIQRGEIDEARFWSHEDIVRALGTATLTPNFEEEYGRLCQVLGRDLER